MKKNKTTPKKHLEKVIWGHDLKPVELRIVAENNLPSVLVAEAVDAYRHYMLTIAETGETRPMTELIVDLVWHTHIIHTKDYFSFCNKVFGGYLHHDPVGSDSVTDLEENKDSHDSDSAKPLCIPTRSDGTKPLCIPTRSDGTKPLCIPTRSDGTKPLCIPTRSGGIKPLRIPTMLI